MHQRVDAALGHLRRRVDAQGCVAGFAEHQLFAPVAQQICGKRRRALGAVVRRATARIQQGAATRLGNRCAVFEFTRLIGIPIDEEVAPCIAGNRGASRAVHAAHAA